MKNFKSVVFFLSIISIFTLIQPAHVLAQASRCTTDANGLVTCPAQSLSDAGIDPTATTKAGKAAANQTTSDTKCVAYNGPNGACSETKTVTSGGDSSKKDNSDCEDVSTSSPTAQNACISAQSTCNMITPQEQALITAALQSAKSAMSGVASTNAVVIDKSAATSCKVGAAMSAVAGAATLALAVACETKVAACRRANKVAVTSDDDKQAEATNNKLCGALDQNWVSDGLQALNYAMSYEQNTQCAKAYDAAAAAAVPQTCQQEPTRPDCICVINPNDPSCLGQTATLSASTGFSDSSLRGNGNSSSADDSLGMGPDAVAGSGGQQNAGLPGATAGGAAGGPSLLGGKASPDAADGAAPGPYNTNVISGTTSGGGGNPYARGGGDGEGNNSSLLSALANKFNLKKYLPGAGATRGPASGAYHSSTTDIFQAVSSRYQRHGEMTP